MAHLMDVVELENGYDLYTCTECKRRFMLSYPPEYNKIVLEEGDWWIPHSGGRGGIIMGEATVMLDENLEPFERWAEEHLRDEL